MDADRMIRKAKLADVSRIVDMGMAFRKKTSYDKFLSENPGCMENVAKQLISNDGLLLSEHAGEITGMLGFVVYSHFISGERIAGEVFWWVDERHRGKDGVKLLKEMERCAQSSGAKRIQMIAPNNRVAEFYERTGYEFVESTYQKSLPSRFLLFDDFASDFDSVREAVVSGGFSTETGPDGASYTGISKFPVPHWYDRIGELIGSKIVPRISCFRLNLKGELPHSWVHSDDICAKYASVLYLNTPKQCGGGTAFWKHRKLGIDRLPPPAELNGDADSFYEIISDDWKELSLWEQIDFVPMKSNRFITYQTCLFHSRFPFEGFGSGPKDGRLIWICFYDKAEELKHCELSAV
jgi:GNAT superfamily N-acetyltransferase